MLAEKIEVEMMPQVETKMVKGLNSINSGITLPSSYLFSEDGIDCLFEVEEGTGWKSGILARKISNQDWQLLYESETPTVQLNYFRDYTFICTASRIPHTGEAVGIIKNFKWEPDTWLVYLPEGVPEFETLPVGMELVEQNENSLLLSVENSKFPFFEHRAIHYDLNQIKEPGMRVFSLNTVEDFLNQIPLLTWVVVLLLIPVILWAFSCFLSVNADKNKWIIVLNVLLVIGALFALKYVLGTINLPAAMLPDGNILDLEYYSDNLSMLLNILNIIGAEGKRIIALQEENIRQSVSVFYISGLCAVGGLALEGVCNLFRHK